MGYILAATDNDAYNALVCTRFVNEFERKHVFQLPMPGGDKGESKGFTPALRGRRAFSEDALYEDLLRRHFQGWRFQKTRITDEYSFEQYQQDSGSVDHASIIVRANSDIRFDDDVEPGAGDTIINFLPPKPEEPS